MPKYPFKQSLIKIITFSSEYYQTSCMHLGLNQFCLNSWCTYPIYQTHAASTFYWHIKFNVYIVLVKKHILSLVSFVDDPPRKHSTVTAIYEETIRLNINGFINLLQGPLQQDTVQRGSLSQGIKQLFHKIGFISYTT